ncbi:MAG: methyltransferase domain-containing protein [Phycisphaeraceae bacterium]|nr:methyltransferase domain-containing protein [Phycisphaerae bacterium]MBX3391310.1 methyltransferase domain-containing protein [Phycisphaeraceae bacterium]
MDDRPSIEIDPADIGLGVRVVHVDEDVIVVDKPTGLVTAPMPGTPEHDDPDLRERSVFGVVKRHVKDLRRTRGTRVWVIHRLDKEASGLLVFAVSDRAFEQLKEEFRTKRAHRLYMAVVEGEISISTPALPGRTPAPASGIIRSSLAEGPDGLMRSIDESRARPRGASRRPGPVPGFGPGPSPGAGQNAVTHWRVAGVGNGRTLVQLRLDTGRKNQIRVHMRELGRPLVGDRRYGGRSNPISRLCLHATELGFSHPATGRDLRFFSPPPQAFYGLIGEIAPPNTVGRTPPSVVGAPRALAPSPTRTPHGPRPGDPDGGDTSWDHVADWYGRLIGEGRSDHHEKVILPGVLRLLRPESGMKVLDLACGQGDFCRRLWGLGVEATGVDASPRLIEAGRAGARAGGGPDEIPAPVFVHGDVRRLADIPEVRASREAGGFDAVTSLMALMNMEPLDPVLSGAADSLRPGGALVLVILHPAFRSPGQTSWGWEHETGREARRARGARAEERGAGTGAVARQYRRVDGYLSPGQTPIVMNPGGAAHGADAVTTLTFHRPIQTYARLLFEAGFVIEAIEEWPSARKSQPGPKAAEENRARREIPMFLAIRARLPWRTAPGE